ncbi:MAG: MBL fold metallo-hydrolase [Gammaproteobacteria bacterium]|nr:MBL fold metallo-hydrolase [Gammaproteobacteria bacterium]
MTSTENEQAPARRLLAPNPGLMTGPGTNTWLIGERDVIVVDPGPAMAPHIDAIIAQTGGSIAAILVTHTHRDHSPGAALLAERTGVTVYGMPPPDAPNHDTTFRPDITLADGDLVQAGDNIVRAIHTPGHASNHLCYLLEQHRWLFTGDHINHGSTVVIAPPDGDMLAYLTSLRNLQRMELAALAPGHGDVIYNAQESIAGLIAHRLRREAKIIAALTALPGSTVEGLVPEAYDDVPEQLHHVAAQSLLAHLNKLAAEKRAREMDGAWFPLKAR